MRKCLIACLLFSEYNDYIVPVKPIVYFSDVLLTPLEVGEIEIGFSFHAPLAYSESYTSFSCELDNDMKDHFSMFPGMYLKHEFRFTLDNIEEGAHIINLKAESSLFAYSKIIEISTPKRLTYEISHILDNNKVLDIEEAKVGLDQDGFRKTEKESFEFLFEPFILSSSCFKLDFSSIKLKYYGSDETLNVDDVEILLFGTMDDFPRLQFDDDLGGYLFKAKLVQDHDFYQLMIDENFFVDYDTYMISRAAGDYFYPTNQIYISKKRRLDSKEFSFQISFRGMGYHQSQIIYKGQYLFLKEALGEEGSQSAVYLKEEDNDPRLSDNWEIW